MARRRTGGSSKGKVRHGHRPTVPASPPGVLSASARGPARSPISKADPEDPQALVVTYQFDPRDEGEPYVATIRVRGKRIGAEPRPSPEDTFIHDEVVRDVLPGAGPVAATSWIYGINPGDWNVTAEVIGSADRARGRTPVGRGRPADASPLRVGWSWRRWNLREAPDVPVRTRWAPLAPFARTPAVIPGSFTALALLGISASFVVQSTLLDRLGGSVGGGLLVSLLALLAGVAGAKVWHMVLQAKPWRESIRIGWSVDGFLVVGPLVAIIALVALDVPIGTYLDSVTPGMYVAVAIGRLGCFFTGCCAGRSTRSRFGIRSSDRRVVARRIPTQLLESGTGLVIAIVSWLAVVNDVGGPDGLVFFLALAAYGLARQGLLRLREESRAFSWRRSASAGMANP